MLLARRRTLFVNLQGDGLTLAVRGPFEDDARCAARRLRRRGSTRGLAALALAAWAARLY